MPKLTKAQQAERDEAIAWLKKLVQPGDTIHTILRGVNSTGMKRYVDLVKMDGINPYYLTRHVATAIGARYDTKREALVMDGCGMDVGFEAVYHLGRVLFPEGGDVKLSVRRHQEERNGETIERDGGYLLKHVWL